MGWAWGSARVDQVLGQAAGAPGRVVQAVSEAGLASVAPGTAAADRVAAEVRAVPAGWSAPGRCTGQRTGSWAASFTAVLPLNYYGSSTYC